VFWPEVSGNDFSRAVRYKYWINCRVQPIARDSDQVNHPRLRGSPQLFTQSSGRSPRDCKMRSQAATEIVPHVPACCFPGTDQAGWHTRAGIGRRPCVPSPDSSLCNDMLPRLATNPGACSDSSIPHRNGAQIIKVTSCERCRLRRSVQRCSGLFVPRARCNVGHNERQLVSSPSPDLSSA
jgi:hypothetical protein